MGACHARFDFKLGGVPYDHKYMYGTVGYNLKPTEIQAALGVVQAARIDEFGEARRRNFDALLSRFRKHEDLFVLPESHPRADPSWFAFWATVRPAAGFTRNQLASFLEGKKIQTRVVFAGNLVRQPALKFEKFRVHESLESSDTIAARTMFIGVFPGLTGEMLDYVANSVDEFVKARGT
jgi:CDP-6-deoxy-D-xylo-4-hexulose-3-dehydrase